MRRLLMMTISIALLATSCSSHHPTAPASAAATAADLVRPGSPELSTRAVLECCQRPVAYAFDSLLTGDFQFRFAPGDSAGNSYRDRPWLREDEMASRVHMLVGGGPHPPVRHFHVAFDGRLIAQPDPRPGMNPTWHRVVRTRVEVTMSEHWGRIPTERLITGYAMFYLVRGDSAQIPNDLVVQGWKPDSTRWWLQRWDDETLPVTEHRASAAVRRTSWGQLKADYR